jgi:hypothetical protein
MELFLRTNCEEVANLLKQLPQQLQDKYGARALQASAAITVMAVKGRMPSATGLAKESIGATQVKFYRSSGTLFTAIEPLKGFRRIVTATASGKTRIRSRKTTTTTAAFSRVQDPRKYMHLIEGGRKAVSAKAGSALHSALDPQNRFFMHAGPVAAHPIFGPAVASVTDAARIMVEVELEKGITEFNQMQTASVD